MKDNIYLIGMPGCGKSTVGKALANKLKIPFADTDTEFEKETGVFPSDYISRFGETAFRTKESEILQEISLRAGQVIATGGGIVLRAENREIIKKTGKAVYIRRDLKELPDNGRILSKTNGVEKLFEQRRPLYEATADITVDSMELDRMIDFITGEL